MAKRVRPVNALWGVRSRGGAATNCLRFDAFARDRHHPPSPDPGDHDIARQAVHLHRSLGTRDELPLIKRG